MTPNQLKNSILQLAIQGKLVEQRPEEGTAEELLKQIQAEKAELIKQGKIKKDKNESTIIKRGNSYFEIIGTIKKCIDDELPFEIPDSWCWARLGNIFNLQAGKNITASDITQEKSNNYPYLCYGGNGIRGYVCSYNRDGHFAIIGRQGALCGCINFAKGKFYATEHAVVVNHFNITDVIWGGLFLRALNLNQYATATAQPGLSVNKIAKVLIPLPPLAEQHRIVAKIKELLPMVEKYGEAYNKLETLNKSFPAEIKKSILQYAIQGKLTESWRLSVNEELGVKNEELKKMLPKFNCGSCHEDAAPRMVGKLASDSSTEGAAMRSIAVEGAAHEVSGESAEELLKQIQAEKAELIKQGKLKKEKPLPPIKEEEIPFDIPDTWRWVRFGDAIKLTSGQDLQPSQYNDKNDGIPYLTGASNIDNEQVVINRWTPEPRSYAYKGDLLLTCKGTVGKTAILKEEKVHIARQIMAISLICGLDIKYVEAFIKSQIEHLKNNAKSIIPGIERNKVLNLVFPLPPLNEQQAIVTKIEKLFSLANTLTNKV